MHDLCLLYSKPLEYFHDMNLIYGILVIAISLLEACGFTFTTVYFSIVIVCLAFSTSVNTEVVFKEGPQTT